MFPPDVEAALSWFHKPDAFPNTRPCEEDVTFARVLARYIREQAGKTCIWSQEDEESGVYSAACHPAWLFGFSTDTHDEHWTNCPYCGLTLVWAKAEPWKDEDEEREG